MLWSNSLDLWMAGPVIDGGLIYTAVSAGTYSGQSLVQAWALATGVLLWTYLSPVLVAYLASANGLLFAAESDHLEAIDEQSWSLRWTTVVTCPSQMLGISNLIVGGGVVWASVEFIMERPMYGNSYIYLLAGLDAVTGKQVATISPLDLYGPAQAISHGRLYVFDELFGRPGRADEGRGVGAAEAIARGEV